MEIVLDVAAELIEANGDGSAGPRPTFPVNVVQHATAARAYA